MVLALAVVLTILFSSPDDKPSTIKSWSRTDPVDFVTTATTELDGSSGTGSYGPPYNHASERPAHWFIHLAKWLGVSHPINTAQDFVLAPLRSIPASPRSRARVSTYEAASAKHADHVDERLREGARQGDRRPRAARSPSSPATTGRCRR